MMDDLSGCRPVIFEISERACAILRTDSDKTRDTTSDEFVLFVTGVFGLGICTSLRTDPNAL